MAISEFSIAYKPKLTESNFFRLCVLAYLHFLVDFYAGLKVTIAEPTLTTHLNSSLGEILLLIGMAGLVVNFSQPIASALLPKKGLPIILLICPILASVISFIGLTDSYIIIGIIFFISAIGIGVLHPEGTLTAHSLSGNKQGLGMALFISGGFFGFSFGGWVSAAWASHYGLDGFYIFIFLLITGVILVFISGLLQREGQTADKAEQYEKHQIRFPLIFLLSILISTNIILFTFMITPFFVRKFGPSAQFWGGSVLFTFGIFGALGSFLWGHLSEKTGRLKTIAFVQIFSYPFLYFLLINKNIYFAPVLGALTGFFMASVVPLVIILGRSCPGKFSRLRVSMLQGGSWGTASIFVIAISQWIDTFPKNELYPVEWILHLPFLILAVVVILALLLVKKETGEKAVQS